MIEDPSKTTAGHQSWEETIEDDHDVIKGLLGRLDATTDLHVLSPLLEQLRGALVDHFAREEAPEGEHELIESMAPHTVASLQNILAEHPVFVERLDDLIARAQACLKGPMAEILLDAGALAQSLRDHEARETALFTDAVFTDLGRSS